jgi:hypothetical protein
VLRPAIGQVATAADGEGADRRFARRGMRLHQTRVGGHVPDEWQTGTEISGDGDLPSHHG